MYVAQHITIFSLFNVCYCSSDSLSALRTKGTLQFMKQMQIRLPSERGGPLGGYEGVGGHLGRLIGGSRIRVGGSENNSSKDDVLYVHMM